ncbi:beta-ketoacyl synthase N-terminal-like domain-containing protein [Qaidamihabitans albus]|uniref:beta-ketoacyl synthase N-terminal-like domain-containing protein n=1 Tax=Qaidamihabitans albus TaxID=2795733 RepID=UPI0018F15C6B|nr:beta-ketoacyl synthase N-terminal-like domain-containing protein [Qaidamihabitans albus]
MSRPVVLTRWAVCLPGLPPGTTFEGWAPDDVPPPERAGELLGRKGLLAKEPATRLALCAVHRAFGLPERAPRRTASDLSPDTAVVISSNLGNIATVARLSTSVREEGVRAASPLDAPNASGNVIASTVAIWFRFGGPNLTVCSGHPSGLDAVGLGHMLLLSGRARRVVVVGVEPRDATADALLTDATGEPGVAVAACVVLEPEGVGAPLHEVAPVSNTERPHVVADRGDDGRSELDTGSDGRGYGAEGVLQVAVAAAVVTDDPGVRSVTAVCGSRTEGFRSALVGSPRVTLGAA